MKYLISILLLLAGDSFGQQNIYSAYERKAHKQAKGLVALYYGLDNQIVTFDPAPGGAFHILIKDNSTEQTKSLYLLSDLEHLIEGKLLSPLETNASQVADINPLKRIAQANKQLKQQIADFEAQARQFNSASPATASKTDSPASPLVGNTAATLLGSGFKPTIKHTDTEPYVTHSAVGLDDHFKKLTELNALTWGTGNKVLYAFVDLNCPACRQAHRQIAQSFSEDELTIHYIPVGILGQDSEIKAVLSLAPTDNSQRLEAFDYLITTNKAPDLQQVEVDELLIDQGWQKYKENTLAFLDLPRPVTPTFAVMGSDGPIIRAAVNTRQISALLDVAIAQNGRDTVGQVN
jgi:protein-disulfide isomerase